LEGGEEEIVATDIGSQLAPSIYSLLPFFSYSYQFSRKNYLISE